MVVWSGMVEFCESSWRPERSGPCSNRESVAKQTLRVGMFAPPPEEPYLRIGPGVRANNNCSYLFVFFVHKLSRYGKLVGIFFSSFLEPLHVHTAAGAPSQTSTIPYHCMYTLYGSCINYMYTLCYPSRMEAVSIKYVLKATEATCTVAALSCLSSSTPLGC